MQKWAVLQKQEGRRIYLFDNKDEYEMIAETKILAPFLDIAAEAPGILTEQEEIMGVNEVIQSEREASAKSEQCSRRLIQE